MDFRFGWVKFVCTHRLKLINATINQTIKDVYSLSIKVYQSILSTLNLFNDYRSRMKVFITVITLLTIFGVIVIAETQNDCVLGRFFKSYDETCVDCPSGKYSSEAKQDRCQACPAGFVNNIAKSTSCQACPDNKYQRNDGKTTCADCDQGFFTSAAAGHAACDECAAGKYGASITAADRCISCPSGFNRAFGSSDVNLCDACGAGSFSIAGQTMCTFCPVGKRETLGSCVSCLVGEFNEQAGATECKKCDSKKGLFSDKEGVAVCSKCKDTETSTGSACTSKPAAPSPGNDDTDETNKKSSPSATDEEDSPILLIVGIACGVIVFFGVVFVGFVVMRKKKTSIKGSTSSSSSSTAVTPVTPISNKSEAAVKARNWDE